MQDEQRRKSLISSVVIGSVTGGAEAFISNPLVALKTHLQNKGSTSVLQTYNSPSKLTNFLYRGTQAHVLGMSTIVGVRMSIRDLVINRGFGTTKPTLYQEITAAYAGGAFSALLTAPMELGMTLQQTASAKYKAPSFTVLYGQVLNAHGWRKGFTGLTCVALRDGVVTSGFLTLTTKFKRYLQETLHMDAGSAALCAGIGVGTACAVTTHPLDTIKTIQQVQLRDANNCGSSAIIPAAKRIFVEDGIRGFYRGLFFRTMRVAPHVALVSAISAKLTDTWHNQPYLRPI